MFLEDASVLWNTHVQSDYYRLGLRCHARYRHAMPGQFVTLHLPGQKSPLLRRPFSIHRLVETDGAVQGIEILYKVVGEFTQKLAGVGTDDMISLFGPLGNGFSIPVDVRRLYLAAGGVGVAPMMFLIRQLKKNNREFTCCSLFLGGRTHEDVICESDFSALGVSVHVTTDDGSYGDQCLLTTPLEAAVQNDPPDLLIACGPKGMLACVAGIAERYHVKCQMSLETMMACGMGVCLGCAVAPSEIGSPYFHACINGPVFDSQTIII
ncbi:MAG: dihydroorotate dehydrogenase electron transfer subunit [Desulfatirhabdiaceae bacterium]